MKHLGESKESARTNVRFFLSEKLTGKQKVTDYDPTWVLYPLY